jgi:hypothetical protein
MTSFHRDGDPETLSNGSKYSRREVYQLHENSDESRGPVTGKSIDGE